MSTTIITTIKDLEEGLLDNQRMWEAIPQSKKDPAIKMVLDHMFFDKGKIVSAIIEDRKNWYCKYHFNWGMGVRNAMREKGFGEKYWPVDNLDDIYVYLIEDALGVSRPKAPGKAETKKEQHSAYAALCRNCNGWRGVSVDIPEMKEENAISVAEWIRSGLAITTVPVEDIRSGACKMCECQNKQKPLFE